MGIGKHLPYRITRESGDASRADHQHLGWGLGDDGKVLRGKLVQSLRTPGRGDFSPMDADAVLAAPVTNLDKVIAIGAKERGGAGNRWVDITRQCGTQGRASISLISSSLSLKRPASASMTGLAI